jgi:alkanesulfonate monooxygenase SsuD/methylene tetrahydromethanopterin reductase-like flavin-dependent oxidoreductase (luciferase family)
MLDEVLASAVVGSPETVRRQVDAFVARTEADEVIVTAQIFDQTARLRSLEITASVRGDVARGNIVRGLGPPAGRLGSSGG